MSAVTTQSQYGKVAVLMGGDSAEREVSLKSGNAVLQALLRQGVNVIGIDAGADVIQQLQTQQFDRAFIALHGRGGEDGVIQGALETIKMPYTGSGVLGSALAMDKYRTKALWRGLGLPTPESKLLLTEEDLSSAQEIGFPLMIKPTHEGSSIGMAKVESGGELQRAWEKARCFDSTVLAERFISGAEYTATILQDQSLPLIRLQTPHDFYDYEAKYQAKTTIYHCPCGLGAEQEQALQRLALQAFNAVGASGWGRVDLMLDGAGDAWLIEVNTVPGMTDHSLVPMAAQAAEIGFDELVMQILQSSLEPTS